GVLLAGGLNPDNVVDAIQGLGAWGVDVSSGVETDGDKDDVKIHDFVTEALSA
ncbi:MAG: N-(5'-phosphoribosyl)anthranilate isomerase, partial [Dehalococcoidia bacterium]|nr:N-(5'-phosphoribosyl)anthranilate isomerase [Dehalococcoidia bacterium]